MSNLNETNQELIDLVVSMKDKDENETLGQLIGKGIPFNKAKGILKKIQESQGLIYTKEARDEKAAELLSGFEVNDEITAEDVQEQVDNLMGELSIKLGMARSYVKAMFDEEELPMPKATRTGGGTRTAKTPGFNGDALLCSDFLIANKDCTKEEFTAFMVEQGKDKTSTGADKVGRWWGVVVDLKVFAEKYASAE